MAISWHSKYVCFAAYVSLAISGLITIAWLAHISAIVRFLPSSVPMQFNTALCFLFLCLGVIALHHSRPSWALWLSALSTIFASATGLEYVTQRDFGLTQLFIRTFPDPLLAITRMAPNTALSILLLGIGMIASVYAVRPKAPFIALIAFSFACALGIVPLLGYISGVESAYEWENFVSMSVASAVVITLLGSAMIVHLWSQLKTTK